MKRIVRVSQLADNDMDGQFFYLADRNPEAARRFYVPARETFDAISENPGVGVLKTFDTPELAGMRMRAINGFQNFLAFYIASEEHIEIVRVLHGAQDIARIFNL